MKKIISVLFVLCLCMAVSAQQHMKFMGIPLDGTVDNFALKLKAKGVTYDAAQSKAAGPGVRVFNGRFMAEDAIIVVAYIPKNKMVFSAEVELQYPTVESAHIPFLNLIESLQKKYPNTTPEENLGPDGDVIGLAFNIPDETGDSIGFILQELKPSSSGHGVSIFLTYTDMDIFLKCEAIFNEDL
jgi:hypothetical protein|nr:MAG TPA: Ail/Lom protein [Caudoviricetes sp.]